MIKLDEKDIKIVGNARFFRKNKWKQIGPSIGLIVGTIIAYTLWPKECCEPPWGLFGLTLGMLVALIIMGIYWDRKQKRWVREFVEEWKSRKEE